MLGLGETFDEVVETMDDLRSVGCQVITLGQYLQPTPKHLPVVEFIHPDVLPNWRPSAKKKASAMWKGAACSLLVPRGKARGLNCIPCSRKRDSRP